MNNRTPLSLARLLAVIGLVVAAVGISTLFLTNSVTVPAVAVGPILLLAGAAFVGLGPWRWTPIAAIVLSLFILGGAFIAPGLFDRLSNPAQVGGFAGTWLQVLGLFTALAGGIAATRENYQTRTSAANR